ncbi:Ff.00g033320.m01.CDS01 [Fusarium sp. VM40]|nr:Ff.00g033320.m01.CDS01 [Fusarium sp. VM40]
MTAAPRYEIEHHTTSIRDDDRDARFKVRRNGKAFYPKISPSQFVNSPMMTDKYLSYLEVLRSGEEVLGDIYDTDVYEWVMAPFELLFAELAPSPPGLPEDVSITLKDHLFPEFFVFALDIVAEKLCPRRIAAEQSPHRPSFVRFDNDFLDDLETWTAFYDPAGIMLSFKDAKDALFKPPNKVLIDNCQTECFFKPCNFVVQIKQELKSYKIIHAAGLDSQLYLCHLYGVVMDDSSFILGLLLTYIDNGDRPLSTRIHPDDPDDPPAGIRERWVGQLDDTLSGLHKAGIVWGDVKAENVLVDKDNNAWISDFGGGYTEGWVDRQMAGTVEGDLVGMAKLKKLIFPSCLFPNLVLNQNHGPEPSPASITKTFGSSDRDVEW